MDYPEQVKATLCAPFPLSCDKIGYTQCGSAFEPQKHQTADHEATLLITPNLYFFLCIHLGLSCFTFTG